MTEAEWRAGTFSTPLLEFLRKQLLGAWPQRFSLALACCQAVRPKMSPAGLHALEVAERFVAGQAADTERAEALQQAGQAADEESNMAIRSADWCAYRLLQLAGEHDAPQSWNDDIAAQIAQVAPEVFAWTGTGWHKQLLEAHRTIIADWVRDIFHPFRKMRLDREWVTPAIAALARTVFEQGFFEAMPSLADALAKAGCDDKDILAHCREPGHVRGCWLLELILKQPG